MTIEHANSGHVRISDLHGASRLGLTAVEQVAGMVESLHGKVLGLAGLDVTTGISGFAWRRVRATTAFAGRCIDAGLGSSPPGPLRPSSSQRDAAVAALNGLFGDYLASSGNALAIPLQLRRHGHALELDQAALAAALPGASGKLVILVHGLCCSDRQWRGKRHDHGMALERDLGYTALYLHYNSGRHISANGREFAALLEQLVQAWPVEIEEIALVGHSMGGLVARSACHYGKTGRHAWVRKLRHMVFLGTPHHGAPLERAVHRLVRPLVANVITGPVARLAHLRSAGITDLRYGNLVDEDWHGRDRFAHAEDQRKNVPLPRGVKCYTIAGSTGRRHGDLRNRLLGDGLVPLETALGQHQEAGRTLAFARSRSWVAFGVHHMELLSHAAVYGQIRDWLGGKPNRARAMLGARGATDRRA